MDPLHRTRVLGQRYLDGLASAGEVAELEGLLQADPVAADAFARLSRLEADLSAQFSEEPPRLREAAVLEAIERHHRRRLWWGRGLRLAVAAGLLLLLSGSLLWWFGQPVAVEPPVAGNVVLEGEVLVNGQAVENLDDGAPLLVAGPDPALLRLSDGSRAELEPASEAVVHGRSSGFAQRFELIEGEGRFTVWKASKPFLVDTPAGSVRTADSVFTVRLTKTALGDPEMKTKNGLLAVIVSAGLVQVETDKTYQLSARESRVFAFQRDSGRARETRPVSLFAVVSEIKDGKLTISIGRRNNPTQETLDVPASVKVFVDGKPAKLASLAKGMQVRIQKNNKGELVSITTEGPTVNGTIKAVAAGKITLEGGGRAFVIEKDTDYAVPANARITVGRQIAQLSDLKPGHGVMLKLSIDRKSALVITSMGLRQERSPTALGEIKAIDVKAGTITLSAGRGNQERTLTLGEDVRVIIDGRPAKLGDLKIGTWIGVRLDREGRTVQTINTIAVRRPAVQFLSGVVAEIKDNKLTVSLGRRNATNEKTFDVGESVRVFVDGKPAKLADVVKGMMVQLGHDDKDALIAIRAERSSVSGKVKEITAKQITLQGRRGGDLSYPLSPNVTVLIDRKPAKVADVKADMEVMMKLSVDGKTVQAIAVRTANATRENGNRERGRQDGRRQQ
jgi:ferric-dicitrate binding protein FerR (iron transport regulator)